MKLPLLDGVAAMRARLAGTPPPFLDVSADTRSLAPGQTYLALRGERFDGHEFLGLARERGAAAAVVEDETGLDGFPGLIVDDTRAAYLALGGAVRARFCGAVVAITGSAGKTTTKTFLAQLLEGARIGEILATPANENNEIGVAKLLCRLDRQAAAVIEMGARNPDDIAPLVASARPDVAVLTNVGDAHVGIFGSREELARTKLQIFSGGGRAVLSLSDATSRERFATLDGDVLFCGIDGDAPLDGVATLLIGDGRILHRDARGRTREAALNALPPGEHNVRNLASAVAAALLAGIPLETIARAAADVVLPAGRYQRIATPGGATVIHDAYNASPSGTLATLRAFAGEPGRRIVVLSSMAELGDDAPAAHRRVGAALAAVDADLLLLGGAHRDDLAAGAVEAGVESARIETFAENARATARLREVVRKGDVVIVKGSRMYRLEEIVDAMLEPREATE